LRNTINNFIYLLVIKWNLRVAVVARVKPTAAVMVALAVKNAPVDLAANALHAVNQ